VTALSCFIGFEEIRDILRQCRRNANCLLSGVVPEQAEQGEAAETADVYGPRTVLRQLAQDAGVPHEPESRGTGRGASGLPLFHHG
jgi:hypothetical protein